MLTRITHTVVYVQDQEEALRFYRGKLGFILARDFLYEGTRWIHLNPPQQSDFDVVLIQATKPESKALVGKQSPEAPLFVIASTDCKADYAALSAHGVKFIQEPIEQMWGVEALFVDSEGNVLNILQAR